MNNRKIGTINSCFIITLFVLALARWASGESMSCYEMPTSVLCLNVEGHFLTNVRNESIAVINLSSSKLTYLSKQDFRKFTKVSEIIIGNCEVPPKVLNYTLSLNKLKILLIHNSYIRDNYFTNLRKNSNLAVLSLRGNKLRNIKKGVFRSFSHLDEIDLNHNEISTIQEGAFDGLSTLRKLYISNNALDDFFNMVVFNDLSSLEEIDLSHNKIRAINTVAFQGLPALRKLDFSHNKIDGSVNSSFLTKELFDKLPPLEEIDLSYNEISTIEAHAFEDLSSLRRLDLSQNRLSEVFYPTSLTLRTGCVFQGMLAMCPGPTKPEQHGNQDEEQHRKEERKLQQLVFDSQELQEMIKELIVATMGKEKRGVERQRKNEQQQRYQQQQFELQETLQNLLKVVGEQERLLGILRGQLGMEHHSESCLEEDACWEDDNARGDTITVPGGDFHAGSNVGPLFLVACAIVCLVILVCYFVVHLISPTLRKVFFT